MNGTLDLIKRRHSTRVSFNPNRAVSKGNLNKVLEAARWAPTPHNMQNFEVIIVDERKVLEDLGSIESYVTETFLRENYQQLSSSKEELSKKKVGILAYGFPSEMRDPSKFANVARDAIPMPLNDVIDGAPVILIVTYDTRKRAPDSEGDTLGIIGLGCVMENMWLMATSLGISVRILSDFGDKGVEEETKAVLGIPPFMRIAYGLRLGYTTSKRPPGPRIRREIDDFIHRNHYKTG